MKWSKTDPSWKDNPIDITSSNGLVEDPDGQIRFIGWIARILVKDQTKGRTPRDIDFWLGFDQSHPDGELRKIMRGMVQIEDQPVVFDMGWDFNSFKLLHNVMKDRSLLDETTSHIGEINYYFTGTPKTILAPGNSI